MTPLRQMHRRSRPERDALRAVSHDASAAHMLLDQSLSRLERLILCEGDPRGELTDQLLHVHACAQQIGRLLGDLSTLARGQSIAPPAEQIDTDAVVADVLFQQRDLLAARHISVDIRSPLPSFWMGTPALEKVLTNLVRNAAIHGCDSDDPRIVIAPIDQDLLPLSKHSQSGLTISDNGPGIDPRRREQVFVPGYRLAGDDVPGSGLGLAIVRQLVEEAGGKVFIDSAEATGTRAVLMLPLAPPLAPKPVANPSHAINGRRWRVQPLGHPRGDGDNSPGTHRHG